MNRTFTPQLAPAVLDRLTTYAERFRHHFYHHKQAAYCGAYLQGLLPASGYALGSEYSLADIAITPFLARARLSLSTDIGGYPEGEGAKVLKTITDKQGEYGRFAQYIDDLFARESFKATWDEPYMIEKWKSRWGNLRAKQ